MNTIKPEVLNDIYQDPKECARIVGLSYQAEQSPGLTRIKRGSGFSYVDSTGRKPSSKQIERIKALAIPPAWQDVWICKDEKGHILVTGYDERGRKQYIYHPKWRVARDLLKFYRMILFAKHLHAIRTHINQQLPRKTLDRSYVIGIMLWLLDNTYIRVGNDIYYQENDSIGLSTLTNENVVIAGPVVTFDFIAKSGKQQQFAIENSSIARALQALQKLPGERLFQYQSESFVLPLSANDVNQELQSLVEAPISAKDFRTWGGTLLAFNHLIENRATKEKPEKLIIQAIDAASDVLGNTRAIAKNSYVHPHILSTYGSKNFEHYYQQASHQKKANGLDKRESELLAFLEQLFKEEFDLLKV